MIEEEAPPEDDNDDEGDDESADQEPGHRYEPVKADDEGDEENDVEDDDDAGNGDDNFDDGDVAIPAEIQGAEMQGAEQPADDNEAEQPVNDEVGENGEEYLVETVHDEVEENQGADADLSEQDAAANMDPPRYKLRSNHDQTFLHRFAHAIDNPESQQRYGSMFVQAIKEFQRGDERATHRTLCHVILNQMTAQAGLKKHGQAAIDVLFKEFAQLNKKQVFSVLDVTKLSQTQKRAALRAINLIKEKRDGALKGRTCADGSTQCALYGKEETVSPTLSNDALSMSLVIDAVEGRDVALADVAGAYLNADMTNFVFMKLEGDVVDIMSQLNPAYKEQVIMENGKCVLCVQLAKALYGCVKSALLWYNLFARTLKQNGFVLNLLTLKQQVGSARVTDLTYFQKGMLSSHVE